MKNHWRICLRIVAIMVVIALVVLVTVRFVIPYRVYIGWMVLYLAGISVIFAACCCWLRDERDIQARNTLLAVIGVICILLAIRAFQHTDFHCKMDQLEKQFLDVAGNTPREIIWRSDSMAQIDHRFAYDRLDYHGDLDEIIAERDELLRKYHYRKDGNWWVSTDGARVSECYHWSPFGWNRDTNSDWQ